MKWYFSLILPVVVLSLLSSIRASGMTVLTVTNSSGDSTVPGSLPYFVYGTYYAATTNPYNLPVDTFYKIVFNIPPLPPQIDTFYGGEDFPPDPIIISLLQPMNVGAQVDIDGTTQPGYSAPSQAGRTLDFPSYTKGIPVIDIDGSAGTGGILPTLINLTSASESSSNNENTIQGFCLTGFSSSAINITGNSAGNFIQNNFIGFSYNVGYGQLGHTPFVVLDMFYSGQTTGGVNLVKGVAVTSSYNTIRNNIIDGTDIGIYIGDDPTVSPGLNETAPQYLTNDIQYNYIGIDPSGNTPFPSNNSIGNTTDGICLGAGAGYTFIGPGNVLSGNGVQGIEFRHKSVQGNVIFTDNIGLGADGVTSIPNGSYGIRISNGAYFNAIGGSFGGNVISANSGGGIVLGSSSLPTGEVSTASYLTYVQNNLIGTDYTAMSGPSPYSVDYGSGPEGVLSTSQYSGVTIQGGSTQAIITGNVIAGETEHGVVAFGSSYCYVAQNWIGQSYSGTAIANGGFGVYFQGVYYSYEVQNSFGTNTLGNVRTSGGGSNDIQ